MNLHLLRTGPLKVNTYLVPLSESEVMIIDPADCQYSRDEGSVISYLASKNLKPVAVVLTHGHFDHVSGLPALVRAFPQIQVAIHQDDAVMIGEHSEDLQENALSQIGFPQFLPFVSRLPAPTAFLDDKKSLADTLSAGLSGSLSDEAKKSLAGWEILHTPGHTQGSVCLYNEAERALISGDTLFYQSWGRTDLIGGSERQIHQSLARIADYCDENTKVYPGHEHYGFTLGENF